MQLLFNYLRVLLTLFNNIIKCYFSRDEPIHVADKIYETTDNKIVEIWIISIVY